jgi:hypothetical protein
MSAIPPEIQEPSEDTLVELDDRRRGYFGRVGLSHHRRYLAHTEADGTVILSPAVILAEHELRLLQRPDVLDTIADAHEHPEKLVRGRKRPPTKA